MRRREFSTLLGGVATVSTIWPFASRAQQKAMPVIGLLASSAPGPSAEALGGFREGLGAEGFVEGKNVAIEYRWADGQYDRLPAMAADLADRRVTVIVALAVPAARAAKAATETIPIVFYSGIDAVEEGLVESLARPGGNLTGLSVFFWRLNPKRVQLLQELVPNAKTFGLLVNPNNVSTAFQVKGVDETVRAVGLSIVVADARTAEELTTAFSSLAGKVGGLILGADPFFGTRASQIAALAAQYRLPTIYHDRRFVDSDGLISYGESVTDTWRQVGVYAGKVLKGNKPGDLPIAQPTKFELVINLKTAKALGLTVPLIMQMTANEVIE
jgi:ABC-type uncharacterized transport system substrate-binding protein